MKNIDYLAYMNLNDAKKKAHQIVKEQLETGYVDFEDDLRLGLSYLKVEDEIKQCVLSFYDTNKKNTKLLKAATVIRWLTVEHAHPSEWLISKEPHISSLENQGSFHILTLLIIAGYQIRYMQSRGIDNKHIEFNIGHLSNYIADYYKQHQSLGTALYTWCLYLASIGLIHIHTLHFMHHVYTDQNIVFRHKESGTKVMIALGGIKVRRDGQFNRVNNVDEYWFTTTFEETKDYYTGYEVNPYGVITNRLITITKEDYAILLQPGDLTIDYHIPTGPGYNLKDVKQSFEGAIAFFQEMYPEHTYQAFWCVSWLSSPQIPLFLSSKKGNIYRINQQSYSFPASNDQSSILEFVFHDKNIDLSTVIPNTSLERDIVSYNNQGNKINCGIFLYFVEDLPLFGTTPYRQDHHYQEFLKLNRSKDDI